MTVLNEAETIRSTLEAIQAQTRAPDQIVIVDGGSTDATLEILQDWAANHPDLVVKSRPGANISNGRNMAISAAAGPIIAVTDAGCTLDPSWLEELTKPFVRLDVDLSMGFYRPDPQSRFERIFACLNLPDADEIDPERFMPSSRSVAFKKYVWERSGGYPEWLAIGEDMYFNFSIGKQGFRRQFAPLAIVSWRLRPDLPSTLKQYFHYAHGDGKANMYPRRHAARFAAYAGGVAFLTLVAPRRPVLLALPAALGIYRMLPAYRRARRRLSPNEAVIAAFALPTYEMLVDAAKMAGYLAGSIKRETHDEGKPSDAGHRPPGAGSGKRFDLRRPGSAQRRKS